VIAVDGTKLAADASDGAIRTYEQIAAEILAEAGRIDAAEDEIHGQARGNELPRGFALPTAGAPGFARLRKSSSVSGPTIPSRCGAIAPNGSRLPAATGRGLARRASGKRRL